MSCQGFSAVVFFFLKHDILIIKKFIHSKNQVKYYHFFIVEVIAESITKAHIKIQSKKKDVLVTLHSKKRTIPIYLTKTVLKRTSNARFSMKKVDFEES